jgi:hypothetical protein
MNFEMADIGTMFLDSICSVKTIYYGAKLEKRIGKQTKNQEKKLFGRTRDIIAEDELWRARKIV